MDPDVAFSPDGETLVSGGAGRTVRLWTVATSSLRHTLQGHMDGTRSVAFSPSGRTLASGDRDGTVRLWEVATGNLGYNTLEGHTGVVHSVVFSPDGRFLASTGEDHTVHLWERGCISTIPAWSIGGWEHEGRGPAAA